MAQKAYTLQHLYYALASHVEKCFASQSKHLHAFAKLQPVSAFEASQHVQSKYCVYMVRKLCFA